MRCYVSLGSLLVPHVAYCPPRVCAFVLCSSGWVVSASLGLRALGYVGTVLFWSAALWVLQPPVPWPTWPSLLRPSG